MNVTPTPRTGFLLSLAIVILVSLSGRVYLEQREARIAVASMPLEVLANDSAGLP